MRMLLLLGGLYACASSQREAPLPPASASASVNEPAVAVPAESAPVPAVENATPEAAPKEGEPLVAITSVSTTPPSLKGQVEPIARRGLAKVKRCFRVELSSPPAAVGVARVRFPVTMGGVAGLAQVIAPDSLPATLATCTRRAFSGARYPRAAAEYRVEVVVTFSRAEVE